MTLRLAITISLCTLLTFAAAVGRAASTALVHHAPTVNGKVSGSVQQTAAEYVTLNSGAVITEDLFVPGTPSVTRNGSPTFGGTIAGSGSATPTNYSVTLNSGATLGHLRTRTDPVALSVVAAAPSPTGTRSVSLNKASDSIGSFGTLRNLTLNSNIGQVAIPAGTYGDFTANSGSGFTLGVLGSTEAVVYAFQRLTLASNSAIKVVGPVVITVANGLAVNGTLGTSNNPDWLRLQVYGGDLTVNSGAGVYGNVVVPSGTVTLNGPLTGGVTADRLTINSSGVLTLVDTSNTPPSVALTAPTTGAVLAAPASLTLNATASDTDGTIASVAFFQNGVKIGETSSVPYAWALSGLAAGNYTFTATATDNRGAATTSGAVTVAVDSAPVAAITAPASVAQGTPVTLTITTSDTDGAIAKVEIYRGSKLVATITTTAGTSSPYVFTDADPLPAGVYTYTVRIYDNLGISSDATLVSVTVLATLPYTADFEAAEGYQIGPIGGQLGWTSSAAGATVTDATAYNGTRSVAIAAGSPPVRIAQAFAPLAGHDVVFADFFARPVAETDVTASTTFEVEGARFAFVLNGPTATLNAFRADASWHPTAFTVTPDTDHQLPSWTRLTARLDFTHKTWDLYAGGMMVAADLEFHDSNATYLSSLAVRGDAATVSRVDYIFAGPDNPLFVDVNNNGIDDAWETAHGLSLADSNRALSPSGNGVTVVQAYIAGTDPNDFYNGVAPSLVIVSGDGQTAAPGAFDPLPLRVRVTNSIQQPVVGAPVSFSISEGAGYLVAIDANDSAALTAIVLKTDSSGEAAVRLRQPNAAGVTRINARAGAAELTFTTKAESTNALPHVTVTAPLDKTNFVVPGPIILRADANDVDGHIDHVSFFDGAVEIGRANGAPYTLAYTITEARTYTLKARAYDDAGAYTDSAAVQVALVVSPPTLQLRVAPESGLAADEAFELVATGGDLKAAVSRVEFFEGDTKVGETRSSLGGTYPDSNAWVFPSGSAAGTHLFGARAYLEDGTILDAPPISVSIGVPRAWRLRTEFEVSEGFSAGPLESCGGWAADANGATVVVADDIQHQVLAIAGTTNANSTGFTVQHAIATEFSGVVFTDFRIKPAVGDAWYSDTSSIVTIAGTTIGFSREDDHGVLRLGTYGEYFYYAGTDFTFPIDANGRAKEWLRITFRQDYPAQKWDIYVNGVLLSYDHDFVENIPLPDGLKFRGAIQNATTTLVDDVYVGTNNPLFTDIDHDGMPDAWEINNNLDPLGNDRENDPDQDGIRNIGEYRRGTSPAPQDSDHDGMLDDWELAHGLSSADRTDAFGDSDHDGLTNREEYALGTNPHSPDSDGDGMPDAWELRNGTDPAQPDDTDDPDGDGVSNAQEYAQGTDPYDYFNGLVPVVRPIVASDGLLGSDGEALILVTDSAGRPLANAPVTIRVDPQVAHVSGSRSSSTLQSAVEVRTDDSGIARVFVLPADSTAATSRQH